MGKEGIAKWQTRALVLTTVIALFVAIFLNGDIIGVNQYISTWSFKLLSGSFILLLMILAVICWDISTLDPGDSHTTISLLIQYIVTRFVSLLGQYFVSKFKKNAKDIVSQQEKLLMNLIKMHKNTNYGKDNRFSDIKSVTDFRQKQPIVTYEHYESYIKRICDGEKKILTESDVAFVAKTSGTTTNSKLFPLSFEWIKIYKLFAFFNTYVGRLKGLKDNLHKQFFMYTPSLILQKTKCGLKIGPFIHFFYRYMPFYSYPRELLEITNQKTLLHLHALFLIKEREVGSFSFMFASQAYSLFKYIEREWEKLYRDIEMGTISVTPDKTDEEALIRVKVNTKPDRERALQFLEERKKGMTGIVKRLWPGLKYCKTITTGSMAVYATHLRNCVLKDVPIISYYYMGSEGLYGLNISSHLEDPCYTMCYMFQFFEFIPVEYSNESGIDLKRVILLSHELQVGDEYELVITNANGLYRYRTGDVIKVKSFLKQCPVFEFMYRTGEIFNINGEKTSESVLYNSLVKVSATLNVNIIDYTTCEDVYMHDVKGFTETSEYKGQGRYVLFIEVDRQMDSTETHKYDDGLCAASIAYNWHRKNKEYIGPMEVIQVQPNTFELLRESMAQEKQNYQQFKLPRKLKTVKDLQFLFDRRMIRE